MKYCTGNTKNDQSYTIRDINSSDVPNLLDYINTLSREQTFILMQGEQKTLEDEQKYVNNLLKQMEANQTIALVVECEGNIAGHATLSLKSRVESHVGSIAISLAEKYRDQGIGKIFLTKLIELAKEKLVGLKILELGVFGNNLRAIHLYESLGFKQYGLLPGGIHHRGEYIDHILMYQNVKWYHDLNHDITTIQLPWVNV